MTSIATGFLEEIGKDICQGIKTKIKVGIILAKTFKDFRESYLAEAGDDSIKLNNFEGFFKDDATKTEFKKIFSGEKDKMISQSVFASLSLRSVVN